MPPQNVYDTTLLIFRSTYDKLWENNSRSELSNS